MPRAWCRHAGPMMHCTAAMRIPGGTGSRAMCSASVCSFVEMQGYTRVHEFKFEFGGRVELEFEFEFDFGNSHELELLRTRTRETHIEIVENSNSNELETR